jgi:AcrR family transcriptional regulator
VQRSDATRAALLRSASRLIRELGMHGASIDRIAADAGYTKGAFYSHFASKEDMFLAVLDEHFAAEIARLDSVLVGAGHPAQEARQAAEGFLANVDADPNWRGLYQEFAVHATRNEAFRLELVARQRGLRERMAAVFSRWASDRGVIPSVPPADVAAMTLFMADGFLLDRLVDPELDDALYGAMIEVFLHGLVAMTQAAAGTTKEVVARTMRNAVTSVTNAAGASPDTTADPSS